MRLLSSKWVLLMLVSVLLSSGCVSKKKFVEMTGYRDRAEKRVQELSTKMAAIEDEFNAIRNDFRYSNLEKDRYIDSLSRQIIYLNSNLNTTSSSIEEQLSAFQIEKRRLNQLLAEKDREIRMSQQLSEERKKQLDMLRMELDALNIQLKNAESETATERSRLEQVRSEQERVSRELEQKTLENKRLGNELGTLKSEVEMLRNQVKLLKSQIGQ